MGSGRGAALNGDRVVEPMHNQGSVLEARDGISFPSSVVLHRTEVSD